MRKDITRTDFYNELSDKKQKEYFSCKAHKFLPAIDNIYYSIFIEGDYNGNPTYANFLYDLEAIKSFVMTTREPQEYGHGLVLDNKSSQLYRYCLSKPDLYDIFIANYLPNDETPRIHVQIRAYGLWTHGADKMLADSYNSVKAVLEPLGVTISQCRENRIDYCYHTNIITNPERVFSDSNVNKHMSTTMMKWQQVGEIEHCDGNIVLKKNYFALGQRKSNSIFIRIYNKALEVIEGGYKDFFFGLWYQQGLISFYDKYCLDYAYTHRDYDYIHKAKLLFYLEYGTNERLKKEFALTVEDPKTTIKDYKNLAKAYMPEVTTVMNIEFETKRRFYYFSDDFIDLLKFESRPEVPDALNRLYRIIDNRGIFLEYLTRVTICFRKSEDKYTTWWERLRNTKLGGIPVNEGLVRDYSSELNEKLVKVKFINTVASNAVYSDNLETNFIEDISDLLSNFNDNHSQELKVTFDGDIDSILLNGYEAKKAVKEKRLKNRKRQKKS